MSAPVRLRRVGIAVLGGALAVTAAGTTVGAASDPADPVPPELRSSADAPAKVVVVDAPTRADRNRVVALGLDVTERATRRGIEVVLHGPDDARTLREAGFTWKVEVADLQKKSKADRRADRAFAAAVDASSLPSGRTSYRTYEEYLADLDALAEQYPGLTRPLTLENQSVLGEDIRGLEISTDADTVADGKPVFLLMGAHHAREWPSSEHTVEFGIDLLRSYAAGDGRAQAILEDSRVIVVPVVNPDGFQVSRQATPIGNFSAIDYEMKRKNCSISEDTPAEFRVGTCDDNPAGRYRGTDLNRNYPGFWGGDGASPFWFSDLFRGDAPGSEPESDAVRQLISERAVTVMISNHTYGNLLLRPPAIAATGKAPDEPVYKALGDSMADANGYASQASYQLYDTSGSTEDWSYWITGGLGFTYEINPDGFHPAYETAVVAEYLGLEPAAGAGQGGNREAYYRAAEAAVDPALHSQITGNAPAKHTIMVRKQHVSPTSPVIQTDGTVDDPILYEDVLTTTYESTGGPFVLDVNPSTRPLVAGRYGREPQADPQEGFSLENPAGVPGVGEDESVTFEVEGLPEADNGWLNLSFSWPNGADWDFYVYGPDGAAVGSGATLDNPEVIRIPDPVPGTYTVEAENYAGGSAEDDWSGEVSFESPDPPAYTGTKEAWMLSCLDKRGEAVSVQEVVVDRGESVDVGAVCARRKP
jgi:hypothetical protein